MKCNFCLLSICAINNQTVLWRCCTHAFMVHSTFNQATSSIRISIEFEIQSKSGVLWFKMFSTDQNNIMHTSVLLSWRVLKFVVIGWICYEQENYKISLNFELDRNIVSGTGARFEWQWPRIQLPWMWHRRWATKAANRALTLKHDLRVRLKSSLYKFWVTLHML